MAKNFGKDLLQAFNTGVSYFLPVVVIGGVFTAVSLVTGQVGSSGIQTSSPFFQNLNLIGSAGLAIMIPVLTAYISYSVAGKPGLAPGFVMGYLCNNPVTVGETAVTTGFLGAMVLGVATGYLVRWMKSWKVGNTIGTIMPVLIIPIVSSLVVGLVYIYVLAYPISIVMGLLASALSGLQGGSAVVLGAIIGLMVAFDMGGPVNKTAATFVLAMMAADVWEPMGAFCVSAGIPSLACGIAALISKSKFDASERQAGISSVFMGLIGISEGAIPFAVKDFVHVVPAIMAGSAVASALAMVQSVACYVPHGGMIVAAATSNTGLYVLDMLIGTAIAVVLLLILKPKRTGEEQQ